MDCNCLFDTRLKVIVGADVFVSVRFFFRTIKGFFFCVLQTFWIPSSLKSSFVSVVHVFISVSSFWRYCMYLCWISNRWSLGAIMYEMLVGYPPFYSDDPITTCRKVSCSKFSNILFKYLLLYNFYISVTVWGYFWHVNESYI